MSRLAYLLASVSPEMIAITILVLVDIYGR